MPWGEAQRKPQISSRQFCGIASLCHRHPAPRAVPTHSPFFSVALCALCVSVVIPSGEFARGAQIRGESSTMDNYYLNDAVELVEEFLESTTDPPADPGAHRTDCAGRGRSDELAVPASEYEHVPIVPSPASTC